MLIREPQIPYIANKIVIDLLNSGFVTFAHGIEKAKQLTEDILTESVGWEREIENEAKEILAEQEEENEAMLYDVNRREVFQMVKKRIAEEEGFIVNRNDRLNDLSHKVIEFTWDNELIDYEVNENKVKNIVFQAMKNFLKAQKRAEENAFDKIKNYKRKLIPGSEEYELVYQKLYEQELKKSGLL